MTSSQLPLPEGTFLDVPQTQENPHNIHRKPSSVVAEDVVIPAHLLRALSIAAAMRDDGQNAAWELYRHSVVDVEQGSIHRSRNGGSIFASKRRSTMGRSTTSSSRDNGDAPNQRSSWYRSSTATNTPQRYKSMSFDPQTEAVQTRKRTLSSWAPDEEDAASSAEPARHQSGHSAISDPRKSHESHTHHHAHHSHHSSGWSNLNPFSTRKNSEASWISHPESAYMPPHHKSRRSTIGSIVAHMTPNALARVMTNMSNSMQQRRGTVWSTYEKAKTRGAELQREKWVMVLFEYTIYAILLLFVYFVLIGMPLWNGAVWWLYWVVGHKFVIAGGYSITIAIAAFYAFAPLLILFEKDPPPAESTAETKIQDNVRDTALLIPCYKSAGLIAATLEAALKIFPPSHIFVLANGNSPTPLDNTEEVCQPYGVNHLWCPIGSKIVAQYVGCYAAKGFKNVLLIDDDCALPDNFPVVTDRLKGNIMCLGYTIKSVGPNSSKGNLCQQAQDLEYKLSGIQRAFAGKIGSATFPHGAIALWDRGLLVKTFHEHPGFSVSEDWFFGHVARKLGSRIVMCTSVFVETETPSAVFFSSGGSRGGFGEMTVFKQRFKRWNFFFVNGMYYDMAYILGSWKLGFWELGAKIFVFQEVYETLIYLLSPFILPISFIVRPSFAAYLFAATVVLYLINTIIFNEVHLRRKNERLGWVLLYVYYLPYKMVLTCINVTSCYWSLYKYARYFAKRHPKVIEDEKAVEVIVRLEEDQAAVTAGSSSGHGRRMTVHRVRTASTDDNLDPLELAQTEGVAAVDFALLARAATESKGEHGRRMTAHRSYNFDHDNVDPLELAQMEGVTAVDFALREKAAIEPENKGPFGDSAGSSSYSSTSSSSSSSSSSSPSSSSALSDVEKGD